MIRLTDVVLQRLHCLCDGQQVFPVPPDQFQRQPCVCRVDVLLLTQRLWSDRPSAIAENSKAVGSCEGVTLLLVRSIEMEQVLPSPRGHSAP